jgi:hypothetical protein
LCSTLADQNRLIGFEVSRDLRGFSNKPFFFLVKIVRGSGYSFTYVLPTYFWYDR